MFQGININIHLHAYMSAPWRKHLQESRVWGHSSWNKTKTLLSMSVVKTKPRFHNSSTMFSLPSIMKCIFIYSFKYKYFSTSDLDCSWWISAISWLIRCSLCTSKRAGRMYLCVGLSHVLLLRAETPLFFYVFRSTLNTVTSTVALQYLKVHYVTF